MYLTELEINTITRPRLTAVTSGHGRKCPPAEGITSDSSLSGDQLCDRLRNMFLKAIIIFVISVCCQGL